MNINLKQGSRGGAVKLAQRLLHLYQDGIYGPATAEAVREFQSSNGLKVDGIIGPSTWTRLVGFLLLPSKRVITEIIVHCTATPAGKDFTVEDITRWHKQQGWSTIGYHYVVYRDGTIHAGRDIDIIGAHCQGHNAHSIGVAYVGGVQRDGKTPSDTRTWKQREAMNKLIFDLHLMYPGAKVYGHRDFDKGKACPSFDARKEYSILITS